MATKTKAPSTNGHAANRLTGLADSPPVEAGAATAVTIPKLRVIDLQLKVIGITPLLVCKMDEKTRRMMEEKTQGKAQNAKEAKDPEREWQAAKWVSTDGWEGVHAGGIRAAIISAARLTAGLTMTAMKQAIFVTADGRSPCGAPLVRIHGTGERHDAICRTTTGVAYPRHRPIYRDWHLILNIQVAAPLLSAEGAINLVSLAGFSCGLGEWRPTSPKSMTGDNGRWRLAEKGE